MEIEIDKPLQEKCGIVGIFTAKLTKQLPFALVAAGALQHRGQQGAGVAIQTAEGIGRYTGNGLIRQVFNKKIVSRFNKKARWTLVHCRYGTFGGYNKINLQPCKVKAKDGTDICVIHNGEFAATSEMRKKIPHPLPPDISDTYLFTALLAESQGSSWDTKLIKTLRSVVGAYSLIIGLDNRIYAARDQFGIRPLFVGKRKDVWIIASETYAFDKVGANVLHEVGKGEIVRIDRKGLKVIQSSSMSPKHFCDFEWAYFGRPNSLLPTHEKNTAKSDVKNWMAISTFRERCGQILAQELPIKNASFVVGVPDSGVYVASGYANELGIPYRQVIIRDHFDSNGIQRLFMRDDQKNSIKKKVLGKLSLVPDRRIWQDAIVVIGDDSIIRGNVSIKITKAIFSLGAKEVHWIIGFPPVKHRCHLGVSIRTHEELIASRHNGDSGKIAKELGTSSIRYISNRGFIKARLLSNYIVVPKDQDEIFLANGGCGGCVTGHYPISRAGEIHSPPTIIS